MGGHGAEAIEVTQNPVAWGEGSRVHRSTPLKLKRSGLCTPTLFAVAAGLWLAACAQSTPQGAAMWRPRQRSESWPPGSLLFERAPDIAKLCAGISPHPPLHKYGVV
jgi:hypothetical protein